MAQGAAFDRGRTYLRSVPFPPKLPLFYVDIPQKGLPTQVDRVGGGVAPGASQDRSRKAMKPAVDDIQDADDE